ncbi:MAG: hypothetical protein AB1327_00875, partial [Bacillota bacterium]
RPRRTSIFLSTYKFAQAKAEGKCTADALTAEAPANVLVGGHATSPSLRTVPEAFSEVACGDKPRPE